MVSVYTLGQSNWPVVTTYYLCTIGNKPVVHTGHSCTTDQFQSQDTEPHVARIPYREWPWRTFAFCSDLGTVGYLTNMPKLGIVGWLLALPYYGAAILTQPNGKKRKEEILYQATGNGIFPFLEAKAGVKAGGWLYGYLQNAAVAKKCSIPILNKLTQSMAKIGGSLIALFTLTPAIGDPISQWVVKQYKIYQKKGHTNEPNSCVSTVCGDVHGPHCVY